MVIKVRIFLGLSVRENPDKTRLTSFLSRILCSSLLFVDDVFSVCFQERLCISFSCCSSLDNRLLLTSSLFSFAFLSPYSAYFCILSNFLVRFCRLALRLLLLAFFVALSLSFQPILTQNPLFTNLNHNNFLPSKKLQLYRYCCMRVH